MPQVSIQVASRYARTFYAAAEAAWQLPPDYVITGQKQDILAQYLPEIITAYRVGSDGEEEAYLLSPHQHSPMHFRRIIEVHYGTDKYLSHLLVHWIWDDGDGGRECFAGEIRGVFGPIPRAQAELIIVRCSLKVGQRVETREVIPHAFDLMQTAAGIIL